MTRIQHIFCRYGWRTPIVICLVAAERWLRLRERTILFDLKLRTKGAKGRGIRLGRHLRVTPGGNLALRDKVHIGDYSTFEIGIKPEAKVSIGEDTWISRDFHLTSTAQVTIGREVLIGEFVSIRDTTHTLADASLPIMRQTDVSGHVIIEDGVWIGRGCLIQARPTGLKIGRGAVIGANSVVTQSVPSMEVWAGAPARRIRRRNA